MAGIVLGCSIVAGGVTFVKYTQVPHRAMVMIVKGIEIAAKSHALLESLIIPESLVSTNWVEKKFFRALVCDIDKPWGVLTETIVVGR
jgi:hypothetical protein